MDKFKEFLIMVIIFYMMIDFLCSYLTFLDVGDPAGFEGHDVCPPRKPHRNQYASGESWSVSYYLLLVDTSRKLP